MVFITAPSTATFDLQRNNTLVAGAIPLLQVNTGDAAQGTMVTGFYNNSPNVLYASLSVGSSNPNSSRNSTDGLAWNAVLPRWIVTDFVNYSLDGRVYTMYAGGANLNEFLSSSELSNWSINRSVPFSFSS